MSDLSQLIKHGAEGSCMVFPQVNRETCAVYPQRLGRRCLQERRSDSRMMRGSFCLPSYTSGTRYVDILEPIAWFLITPVRDS